MLRSLTRLVVKHTSPLNESSDLTLLESIGKVEVDQWFRGTRCCISIGEYGDSQVKIWGEGRSISQAAAEVKRKLEACGLLEDIRSLAQKRMS